MTERTRLISYLLYGLFSAEKKGNVFQYPLARARGHSRSCSLNRNEPGHAIETRRNGFFDNEAIFVFITPRSRANLTTLIFTKQTDLCLQVFDKNFHNARSLQENLARSAANQSARTIVAI